MRDTFEKGSTLSEVIYRFKAISVQIPMAEFIEIETVILKFI